MKHEKPSPGLRLHMGNAPSTQPDYDAVVRSWERRAPWPRRVLARVGLQGKLAASFLIVLLGALGGSCWIYDQQSRSAFDRMTAEHATELADAVGMASQTPMEARDVLELTRIGHDLIKHRQVMAVAFYSDTGALLAIASEDPDQDGRSLPNPRQHADVLMRPTAGFAPAVGRYVRVTAPVMAFVPGDLPGRLDRGAPHAGFGSRVAGYVTVFLANADADAALRRAHVSIVAFNSGALLASIPVVLALVYRIFQPIRRLVAAADRIAAGDLQAHVAIHRPDAIGTLARSFNEMVRRVRDQQQALSDANARLADANRDLEQKVHDRTAQLEAANKRLGAEIAEKDDFLRAVTHDLSAPLRNIAGMASMLLHQKRDAFDDDVVHRLERIQKNVEVEAGLIGELLELSRIKTVRRRADNVDLGELVREVAGMFEADLREKGITFFIDSGLPILRCERSRLRQVFQNLIDNAIKYMGDGSQRPGERLARKEIHVGCSARADEVEFYIEDTGLGIDADDLDKIFFVFRRGQGATARGIPGKGIGLASVKSIVETYNGSIWVDSHPGRGSTFRFTINGKHWVAGGERVGVN